MCGLIRPNQEARLGLFSIQTSNLPQKNQLQIGQIRSEKLQANPIWSRQISGLLHYPNLIQHLN